jgi:hypothetical protein
MGEITEEKTRAGAGGYPIFCLIYYAICPLSNFLYLCVASHAAEAVHLSDGSVSAGVRCGGVQTAPQSVSCADSRSPVLQHCKALGLANPSYLFFFFPPKMLLTL